MSVLISFVSVWSGRKKGFLLKKVSQRSVKGSFTQNNESLTDLFPSAARHWRTMEGASLLRAVDARMAA